MWRLLRDQLERYKWAALGYTAVVLLFPLLDRLGLLLDEEPRDGQEILSMGLSVFLLWAGFFGVAHALADSRGLRVIRALPVRSGDVARSWWLGATAPAVLIGLVVYGALLIVDAVAGRALELRTSAPDLFAPGAASFALVWGCSLAGITWSLGMLVIRRGPRLAFNSAAFTFTLATFYVLLPSISPETTMASGSGFGDVVGMPQVSLVLVTGVALISFMIAPRLMVATGRVRTSFVFRATATSEAQAQPGVPRIIAELLRLSWVVLAVTLGGLLLILVMPLFPAEPPFLVRQTFMLIWLYLVPALWLSSWLSAARVFRLLPLSSSRLAMLPLMYSLVICLAAGASVTLVMVLSEHPARHFTQLQWWLLLCPGLLSLFYGVALHIRPAWSVNFGFWSGLVVLGSVTRILVDLFIVGSSRGGSGATTLLGTFWPGALGGVVLAGLGVALVSALLVAVTVLSYVLAPRAFAHESGRRQRRALTSQTPGEPLRLGYGATGALEPWVRPFGWSLGLGMLLAVASLAIPRAFDPLDATIGMALLASMAVYMSGVVAFTRWRPTLRALRVLPISTNRLPLLLLGQPSCVHAGGLVGAGAVWLVWRDELAWLGPFTVLLVVFFGMTLFGLSVMCWFGLRRESLLQAMIIFTSLVGAVAGSQVRGAERGAAYYAALDSAGAAVGVGVALAVVGFVVLRAAISRRGSLYRSRSTS